MPATQIAFFNHKGGVSKTTSAFNIGWKLAELGKRVMLVDCDSQCNLTGLVLEYSQEDEYPFEGEKKEPPMNIRDGLAPAFEARPVPLKPVTLQQVSDQKGLFVLPGHVGLSEYESTLAIAHELSNSLTALQNIPGSLRYLFNITAAKNKIDYVIIDMSPSLGALNQNLLCSSDAFIVPMAPDFFSAMALQSLARILPTWKKWSDKAASTDILANADYPWPNSQPKYLGSIVQNYRQRARGKQDAKPTQAYQKWFDELAGTKKDVFLPKLKEIKYLHDKQVYMKAKAPLNDFLMKIPDFNSLIAISQTYSKPVFALSSDELRSTGIVLEVQQNSINSFNKLYLDGAQKIINLIDLVENG